MTAMPLRSRRTPAEPLRTQIIDGLLELQRRGIINGVWVDRDRIRIRERGDVQGRPTPRTWGEGAALVVRHRR